METEGSIPPAPTPVAKPAPSRDVPTPTRFPDEFELVRFVKMFLHGARESGKVEPYLVVVVQQAYKDQGLPEPSDADALELLRAIAAKEPSIAAALEPAVQDLGRFITIRESKSTTSPKTKGGSRGR